MWSILFFITICQAVNGETGAEDVTFTVRHARKVGGFPSIRATFSNGIEDNLILEQCRFQRQRSNGDCMYVGTLQHDPSSRVAVTGCLNNPGDIMDITLLSKNSAHQMFTVDYFGNSNTVASPLKDKDHSCDMGLNKTAPLQTKFNSFTSKSSSIPSKLRAVIKFGYEESMKRSLRGESFESWIAKVMCHTQEHFLHETLGTEIHFEVHEPAVFLPGVEWNTYDLEFQDLSSPVVNTTVSLGLNGVTVVSWWSDNDNDGLEGRAQWYSDICTPQACNIVEKQRTTTRDAWLLAHELGHNFGMYHDWEEAGLDIDCTGSGLIMDYCSWNCTNEWSECSKKYFENDYHEKRWGDSCLLPLSGECSNGEWECDDGECVQESSLQDGVCDCNDGSDELEGFCGSEGCSNGKWECYDGDCIPGDFFLDGYCDCYDCSDEPL